MSSARGRLLSAVRFATPVGPLWFTPQPPAVLVTTEAINTYSQVNEFG